MPLVKVTLARRRSTRAGIAYTGWEWWRKLSGIIPALESPAYSLSNHATTS